MYIYTDDNACFSLNYNKKRKKQIEITVDNKRKSIINYEITNTYDKHKTKQSLRANIIHVMDAYIARNIILN
jgi:DNA-directed RNA polymerase